jgi:hypothetical protein
MIHEMLQQRFGKDTVFMDKSTMGPGDKWAERIKSDLVEAKAVLVVIKDVRTWLGVDALGRRNIEKEDDWVRQELELAIKEGKELVPLVVKGGQLPPKDVLPGTLHALLSFNAMAISLEDSWEVDQQKIVDACKRKLEHSGMSLRQPTDPVILVRKFGPSFGMLAAVLHVAESNESFRAYIDQHQTDLCKFVKYVRPVRATKQFHDIAHHVQVSCLAQFKRKLMGSLSSDLEWEFENELYLINEALGKLDELQAENEARGIEEPWFEKFRLRLENLNTAIRNINIELFQQEVAELDSLLKKQQTALNQRLVRLIEKDLRLSHIADNLVDALRLIDSSSEPDQASRINSVTKELCSFTNDFLCLRDVHDIWQGIDNELSLLENHLSLGNKEDADDTEDCPLSVLRNVERELEKVYKKGGPENLSSIMDRMRKSHTKLRDKLVLARATEPNTSDMKKALFSFSEPARMIFLAIDRRLKEKCNELVMLEEVVNELLITQNASGGPDAV